METGLNAFKEALHLKHVEAGEYSPLALAYIGDAVYELAIRTLVMNRGNMQVNKMHKKTANLVKADAQARLYLLLEEELTDAEKAAIPTRTQCEIFYDAEARDDEGLPDGDRI
ncbi:MAG: ribonuclease III domain-containing protein [Clostridium fessum]